MNYIEKEMKVLDVNIKELIHKLDSMGAKKVFDDERVITYFDYQDKRNQKENIDFKLTEESELKLSYTSKTANGKETIKLRVSRKQEAIDILSKLDLHPITEVKSHRISYEWNDVDFDIDEFPQIPAFLEIDLENSNEDINNIVEQLSLVENKKGEFSTPEIYKLNNLDYFNLFKYNN